MAALYRMACWMLCGAIAFPPAVTAAQAADPADALYARRAHLPDAVRAAECWAAALDKSPSDFDAAWKLARAGYWLGGHLETEPARVRAFERGIAAGQKAVAARPQRPEGYFWVAANMGGLAELKGLRAGLRYRTPIRQHLEKVLALDPGFQKGSADRALGRWYYKVPRLFGGSKKKSEEHLRRSLTYHPQSIASRYFLAETYEAMNRDADATRVLHEIEAIAIDPEWAPEDREFKAKARELLKKLSR